MAKTKDEIKKRIENLRRLDHSKMYLNDFFHTWKETDDEISSVFEVAEILRGMRENNISTRFRILMRSSLRLPMARQSERLRI